MKRMKLFNLLLVLIALISCTSCSDISQQEFLDIVNSDMENFTCYMDVRMKVKSGKSSATVDMDINMEVSKESMYMSMESGNELYCVYSKIVDDNIHSWVNQRGIWTKQPLMPIEDFKNNSMLPNEEIEKGDFKYKKGVWVGDVDKLQDKLVDVINKSLETSDMGTDLDIELNTYDIIIEDDKIVRVDMDIGSKIKEDSKEYKVTATYKIYFSKHNETTVTIPGRNFN